MSRPQATAATGTVSGDARRPPADQRGVARRLVGKAPLFPLVVLFGLNAVDELDRTAFALLVPEIRDHFRLDIEGILALQALASVAFLVLSVPLAHYADRSSRIRLARGGATVWAGFSVFTGFAPSVVWLGVARVGSGLGAAVNQPTHNSLLADYYDVDVRTNVYGVHRAANAVGQFVGPMSAGVIAYFFGWRTPFVLFAVPTAVFVVMSLRLREPARGVFERRAAGAQEETAQTEEAPPSFQEAWRTLWQVRSLRRIWFSLPFFGAAFFGLGSLYSIFYEQEFGLNEVQRGFLFAGVEPGQLLGLAIGVPIATRLIRRDPGLVLKFLAAVMSAIGVGFVILSLTPNLALAIAANVVVSALGAILIPGIFSVLSLAIPPKVRSLGFTIGTLFILPGILALPIIGAFADNYGIRRGLLLLVPIYVVGGFVIATAGSFLRADISQVRISAMTQADVRRARLEGDPKMLVVRSLDVSYGQTQVLFDINLDVCDGEIIALLGTNGAGKSTLLKAISGSVAPGNGAIVYDGRDITFAPAQETAKAGMVIVPGGKGTFPGLSVAENLGLAGWLYRKDPEHVAAATERVLEYFPVLRQRWDQKAGNLSGGEQQMLTLGQALIAQPKLLMIDELSLGLAPVLVEELLGVVRAIHDSGTTLILVEQSVNVALTLAERAVFMEKGEIRFDGPTAELLHRPDVLRSVFLEGAAKAMGEELDGSRSALASVTERIPFAEVCPTCGRGHDEILAVSGLSVSFGGIQAVDGVDLSLRAGQVVGLIGPNGAGKTTVFDLISGYLVPDDGRVVLGGTDVTGWTPDARARARLGRSFQEARLFPSMTVRETIAVYLERHIETRGALAALTLSPATREAEIWVHDEVDRLIELVGLSAFADKFVSELSTGSRRIVDLACSLAHDPAVLLLDEPSSGIAQRETEALGPLLLDIRDKTGAGLLVIEHDMPLITAISDQIVALHLGRVLTRGEPHAVMNDARVVEAYLGSTEEVIHRSGLAPRAKPRRRRNRALAPTEGA